MTAKVFQSAAAAVALLLALDVAQAQTTNAAGETKNSVPVQPAAPASGFDEAVKQFKKPADGLTLGADFRARNEYYNNIVTLNEASPLHEQDVIRYRGRLWGTATPAPDFSLNGRLSFEARQWIDPSFVGAYLRKTGMEWRYAMLDLLNAKWTNAFHQPLTITVGRQDIMMGDFYDWWLVMDGTPGDGSWTTHFDSARFTVEAKDIKTKFDLIYINQKAQPDAWLPTIGSSTSYPLTDQNEQGAILYVSNKSVKNTQLDGYFIYKNDKRATFMVAGVPKTPGDNADIGTIGGKITGTPAPNWQYSVEGAYQFGTKYDRIAGVFARRDIRAYGGKGKLTYLLKDSLNNQFSLAGEILSGDDPKTGGTDEMFDILWGRWPRWSELYIYSYIYETSGKIAQMNNLARLGYTWSFVPVKGTSLSLTYNALFALEKTPTRTVAPTLFSNAGRFRGHHVQAVLKRQFNKYISGHLWGEWVRQGDFYTKRDLLTFIRTEIMFTF
jgi:hypothetical protein